MNRWIKVSRKAPAEHGDYLCYGPSPWGTSYPAMQMVMRWDDDSGLLPGPMFRYPHRTGLKMPAFTPTHYRRIKPPRR